MSFDCHGHVEVHGRGVLDEVCEMGDEGFCGDVLSVVLNKTDKFSKSAWRW
jgi:hypothetical protein